MPSPETLKEQLAETWNINQRVRFLLTNNSTDTGTQKSPGQGKAPPHRINILPLELTGRKNTRRRKPGLGEWGK